MVIIWALPANSFKILHKLSTLGLSLVNVVELQPLYLNLLDNENIAKIYF